MLARRRRGLHHLAPGVQRGSRSARIWAQQPGHVSHPAFRRPVPAEPRGGPALSDPAWHRRPPCGHHPAWRDPAGERIRGRPAGHGSGRGHAVARRHVRAGVCGRARGQARAAGGAEGLAFAGTRRCRLLHACRGRSRRSQARRAVWRSPGLLQPGPQFSRAARASDLSPPGRHLALHRGRTAAPGGQRFRLAHPRTDGSAGFVAASGRARGARGGRGRRAPPAARPGQRALPAVRGAARAAGTTHPSQRHPGTGPAFLGQVPVYCSGGGR